MIPYETKITTARCQLRRLELADLPFVHAALAYPGFTDFLPEKPPRSIEDTAREMERLRSGWDDSTRFVFSAFMGNEFAGVLGLRARGEGLWNVGFWVMPSRWGNGLAVELATAGFDWAFSTLAAATIQVVHVSAHQRCQRVMKKMNLKKSRADTFTKDGREIASDVYEISRADWLARKT